MERGEGKEGDFDRGAISIEGIFDLAGAAFNHQYQFF
jgi:hypothetical protein